jgi:hypothetical protein
MIERDSTAIAAGIAQKSHSAPALQAEAVIVLDDDPASGTARRQGIVDDRTDEGTKDGLDGHGALVLCRSLMHKADHDRSRNA